jgi:exportin-T
LGLLGGFRSRNDLEKTILIMFDEWGGAIEDGLKNKAKDYCDEIKEQPSICTISTEKNCLEALFG